MVTTTSTSATPMPTPVRSAASVTSGAATALLESLETGSGVDTTTLVGSLVDAQFAAKKAQLAAKYDTLTAQISGVSTLKNTITDFSKALESLVKGGTLASQPVSSNASVLTAAALPNAKLAGTTASIRVDQLATAQTAVSSTALASSSTVVGRGTLTLKIGTGTYNASGALTGVTAPDKNGDGVQDTIAITIDNTNSTLDGIAAAINAKKAGVTASVVTDADGKAFLSLKGTTGTAQAFTLTAQSTSGNLARVATNGAGAGMKVTQTATNAKLVVDGVAVQRASNEISDLVPGMKLTLTGTSTTPATLTATTPTTALSNAVNDLVDTYNEVLALVKEQTDPITGSLRFDPAAKTLLRSLQALTSRVLLPSAAPGSPTTLAALGVRTNRDGTLDVDDTALAAMIRDQPAAVEAMFAPSATSGIYSALQTLQISATSSVYGLGASGSNYLKAQGDVDKAQDKLTDQADRLNTRLTQQFSSMNARVAAFKATQAYLKQQIDAWTKGDG